MLKKHSAYIAFVAAGLSLWFLLGTYPVLATPFLHGAEGFYLSLALLFALGYGLNYFAPKTRIPAFVWAIFFGMALQIPFSILTGDQGTLLIIVELLAAFVLFAGGVEVPVRNFKKYFAPIASLSLVGTMLTIILFALALEFVTPFFGFEVPAITILLLAAILASIDPTAIIPTLDTLKLKKPWLKDLAVSESAVNDVVGTIITRFFLVGAVSVSVVAGASVLDGFGPLLARETLDTIALEILWGLGVGILGAWILRQWAGSVRKHHWSDPALFFAVPIFTFALGSLVGGSGFLAAFVAGLLFEAEKETKLVHHFFENFVDHFIKPVIFVLLGALVPIAILLDTASVGLVAAAIFMFAIRPLIVFISLVPWMYAKGALFTWREVVFVSFIRETGAIPAILILAAVAAGVVASDFIFAVGMWVILATLIIEPPLTPALAAKLGLLKEEDK